MAEAFILDAIRSPLARAIKGSLAQTRPDDLAAELVSALLARHQYLDRARVDDVIAATAMPEAEQGMNLGRIVAQRAGLPDSVPGMTLNRFCASGLEGVATACAKVQSGMADLMVVVGVESMSRIPMGGHHFSPNPWLAQTRPDNYLGMGLTAEQLADRHSISRDEQDRFALLSHRRAVAAESQGLWNDERVPVAVGDAPQGDGGSDDRPRFAKDELPRADTSLEALAQLKPAFRERGTVTAGNSSPLTDGAAAVLVASGELVKQLHLQPLGRMVSYAVSGVEPGLMGIGPARAVPRALERAGWKLDAVDWIELNEAFAVQVLAVLRELKVDPERVNPQGGAIALGHALGCSGARLTATLLHGLRRTGRKRGIVTMCIGGGMGAAATFEANKATEA